MGWIAVAGFIAVLNSLSTTRDLERYRVAFRRWEPFTWEITSALATLALLPALVWLVERRPWSDRRRWLTTTLYGLAAVGFSAAHVAAMVGLRKVVYAILLGPYRFGSLPTELLYELRKDVVSFFLIVLVLNLLREIQRRLDAPLLVAATAGATAESAGADTSAPQSQAADRVLIRDGGRDLELDPAAIVAVRAAGNYVEVFRIGEKPLMLRATLAEVEARLASSGFARVHRSWLVALAQVQTITPSGSGDLRLRLRDGSQAPVSRRYKDAIQHLRP
jgi:DNA-binding LytR/AlgR family response regulator